jgi:hypothetical protein
VRKAPSAGRLADLRGTNEDLLVRRIALLRRRRRAAFPARAMSALVIVLSAWAVLAVTADTVLGH